MESEKPDLLGMLKYTIFLRSFVPSVDWESFKHFIAEAQAEFVLQSAENEEEYQRAEFYVRRLGLDPATVRHSTYKDFIEEGKKHNCPPFNPRPASQDPYHLKEERLRVEFFSKGYKTWRLPPGGKSKK